MIIIIDLIFIPTTIDIILIEVEDIGMSEIITKNIIVTEKIIKDIILSERDIKIEEVIPKNIADLNMIENPKTRDVIKIVQIKD